MSDKEFNTNFLLLTVTFQLNSKIKLFKFCWPEEEKEKFHFILFYFTYFFYSKFKAMDYYKIKIIKIYVCAYT